MLQEEANVQMAGWVSYLQECKVGCFILDPPMGLGKNAPGWSLCDIMKTINVIDVSFGGEFTIILYSMYSMVSVQDALTEEPMTDGSRLSVSRFTLAKVKSYWSFKSVMFGPSTSRQCCQLLTPTQLVFDGAGYIQCWPQWTRLAHVNASPARCVDNPNQQGQARLYGFRS